MIILRSILRINFLCFGITCVIANSGCPSVSECINILKNVFEDEKRIRASFKDIADNLAQKDRPSCKVPANNDDMKFTNCAQWQTSGKHNSGVYTIYPKSSSNGKGIKVYCDMETDDGGWIVIQRRAEYPGKQINFTRTFKEYREGFGNLSEEFWLGNDNIHVLTHQEEVELRIDLEDFEGNSRYAVYKTLKIGNATKNYILSVGEYSGDAGDSLAYHNQNEFYTYDKDTAIGCAKSYKGGWWFKSCYNSKLNGLYMRGEHEGEVGIIWSTWLGFHYSLKKTEMKIRPRNLHEKT